jgi:hypothetical protein
MLNTYLHAYIWSYNTTKGKPVQRCVACFYDYNNGFILCDEPTTGDWCYVLLCIIFASWLSCKFWLYSIGL